MAAPEQERRLQISYTGTTYSYRTVGGEQEQPASEFVAQIATGDQRYDTRANASFWHMGTWTPGLGIKYGNFREHQGRFYFSTGVDTRFPNQLTLGPLITTGSSITTGDTIQSNNAAGYTSFLGAEYFGLADKVTLSNGTEKDDNAGRTAFLGTYTTRTSNTPTIFALGPGGAKESSPDGATWTAFPTSGSAVGFCEIDQIMVYAGADSSTVGQTSISMWDGTTHTIIASWGTNTNMHKTPRDGVVFRNAAGEQVPYFLVADTDSSITPGLVGLYVVDIYAQNVRQVNIERIPWTNSMQRMAVWNNALMIAAGPGFIKFDVDTYQDVSPASDQGMPPGYGYFHTVTPTQSFLYSVVNNSQLFDGTTYGIACYNGIGWHMLHTQSTPIRGLWASGITARKMWYLQAANSSTTGTIMSFLESAVGANPVNDSTYKYAASGYLITPWYDLGFLDTDKILLDLTIDGQDLTSTETVTVSYQTNGAGTDDTWSNSLAAFTATGQRKAFGASSEGVVCKSVRFKIALARDTTNTLSPKVRGLVLRYLVTPDYRPTKSVLISIDETNEMRGSYGAVTADTMIAEFVTLMEADTLVSYSYEGETATNVKIVTFQPTTYTKEDGTVGGAIRLQIIEPV